VTDAWPVHGLRNRKTARYGDTPILNGYPASGSRKMGTAPGSGQCGGLKTTTSKKIACYKMLNKASDCAVTCDGDNEISGITAENCLSSWSPSATQQRLLALSVS
jgi:hypothetical protein